jgi:hypothetical protein
MAPFSSENSLAPAVPWSSDSEWQEINAVLADLIRRRRSRLDRPRRMAQMIEARLTRLFGMMEGLCRRTCAYCPNPCCLHAKVWLDFTDLVFLHLTGHPVPERQPIRRYEEVCCYWQARGCRLARISRPWICTWYLCPAQTSRIRRRPVVEYRGLEDEIRGIQAARRGFEGVFLEMMA